MTHGTVVSAPAEGAKKHSAMSSVTRSMFYLLVAYLVMCGYLNLTAPNFLAERNLVNILRQMSMIAIIGVGMTMVIIAAEIDLSVGSMAAFSGVSLAMMTAQWKIPLPLAIVLTLAAASLSGLVIGILRVALRIPSFISSLALLTALRSAAFLLSGGFPISPLPPGFELLGNGVVGPIPVPVILMGLIYFIGFVVMAKTPWGRSVYAVGGNEEAARLSGICVPQVKIGVFVISSVLAALAGLMLAARLEAGQAAVAQGWELDVIAAVIIGGTSLFGGSGNILGTLLGGLFMGTLQDGMVLMGVSPFSQGLVSGIVILAAVIMGAWQTRGES
jgi:ribose/xylose/arabinose/galactoside ABC-type transport system permease subunit